MEKKVFFQKLGIIAVSVITLGLLIWAMFIPESNKWWNTYLIALAGGYIYFLVKFIRNMWDDDYGSVLGKICVVSVCDCIFGPTVQLLGLHFAGNNLMAGSNISSLPCLFSMSWTLLLAAIGLLAIYFDNRETGKPLVKWFILFGSIWLLSIQVAFLEGILKVLGFVLPIWLETIFSVVYPIVFIGTAILAFCCIICGILGKL